MFLADGRHDPRPEFMLRLRDAIARTGSIVAFNAAFELGRLKERCEAMLNFEPWLEGVANRVVDLLNPFRSFHYYHPDQEGSASMKAVLPALTGRGYEGLASQEGATASLEFLRITFGEVSEVERQRVRRQLEEYCGQDTEGMIWIVDALRALLQPDAGASPLFSVDSRRVGSDCPMPQQPASASDGLETKHPRPIAQRRRHRAAAARA